MVEFLMQNWGELLVAILALTKVVVNLTPTEKDNKIFGWVDDLINYFITNNKK
jgi:hypothetical protein